MLRPDIILYLSVLLTSQSDKLEKISVRMSWEPRFLEENLLPLAQISVRHDIQEFQILFRTSQSHVPFIQKTLPKLPPTQSVELKLYSSDPRQIVTNRTHNYVIFSSKVSRYVRIHDNKIVLL